MVIDLINHCLFLHHLKEILWLFTIHSEVFWKTHWIGWVKKNITFEALSLNQCNQANNFEVQIQSNPKLGSLNILILYFGPFFYKSNPPNNFEFQIQSNPKLCSLNILILYFGLFFKRHYTSSVFQGENSVLSFVSAESTFREIQFRAFT